MAQRRGGHAGMTRLGRHARGATSSSASRRSRSAIVLRSSGSRRKIAEDFSQSRLGTRGIPGDERPGCDGVRDAGLRRRNRARADRDVAGDAHLAGERDVVLELGAAGDADLRGEQHVRPDRSRRGAICTRLSIFVPAPMRVSPTAGRSIVVLAPISTSSSMTTLADLRDLVVRAVGSRAKPNPSLPMTAAVLQDHAVAELAPARESRRARGSRSRRRCARPARWSRAGATIVRAPMRAPSPIDDERPDRRVGAISADAATSARRWTPAGEARRGRRTARAPAQTRGTGARTRSTAHGAAARPRRQSPPTRACGASSAAYFGLAKKVRSPGPASSMPATRRISMSPSPSRRHPRRSAMSRSFKSWKYTAVRSTKRGRCSRRSSAARS